MKLYKNIEIIGNYLNNLSIFTKIIYSYQCLSVLLIAILPCLTYRLRENNYNCTLEQFSCRTGSGECIALNWMCDNNPDCADGSDEFDCNSTCRLDEFTCNNKYCIQHQWVCDNDDDCGDNSDEKDCSLVICNPENDFACSKHHCIISRWHCDGDFDCPDQSDELNCQYLVSHKHQNYCTNYEFDCGDRITCIHQSWLCDGEKDCTNGADENLNNCKNITCQENQFQCNNQHCISDQLVCDNKIDCINGEDEKNCSQLWRTCDKSIEFECSKGLCIPLIDVCNKKIDCIGQQDENEHLCGNDECSTNNGGCSQKCIDLPIGFRCECYKGYTLSDNIKCNDINECLHEGSCSQFCTNQNGGFKCSCAPGYLEDPKNSTRCKAAEGHASLLFTRCHDIRKLALDRKEMTAIVNGTKMATALDFVFRTGMIFWSDISESKIYKAPIDEGSERILVIDKDLTISDGLAVDWIYNHIYWTNSEKNTIQISNLDGNMRKTLITDHIQKPRAIALNPIDGWMFWTDCGNKARIEKAGMDGSHRKTIIGTDIKWPNGLTLDFIAKRIYWVDAKLNIIGSCDYEGKNRRTILHSSETLKHPFSITMFEDYLYWSDWNKETIFKANKFNGQDIEAIITLNSTYHPMVVHIYHPYKQPDGINQCQIINGHCSHLCLPSPKINLSSRLSNCACPDELVLVSDGLMCIKNVSVHNPPIIYNMKNNLKEILYISGFILIFIVVGIPTFSCLLTMFYKQYTHQNIFNMNFDNPVYKLKTKNQFVQEKNRFSWPENIENEMQLLFEMMENY